MPATTLRFHFDFISHNAWLAWARMPALCERFGLRLEPVPVLFAALLERHGQRGPAEVAPKRAWMLANVLRKARADGTPIAPPHSHPFNPLPSLRAVTAIEGEDRVRLTERLFRATWAESRPVGDLDEVLAQAAAAGIDPESLRQRIADPAVKTALRETTERALDAGVFGVPTITVGDTLFFGYDDLPWLERFLAGDPAARIGPDDVAGWTSVRPSAERRLA